MVKINKYLEQIKEIEKEITKLQNKSSVLDSILYDEFQKIGGKKF